MELKRQSYVEAIKEKAAALAVANTLTQRLKIQKQFTHQESLIDRLKESLTVPAVESSVTDSPGKSSTLLDSPTAPRVAYNSVKDSVETGR